MEQQKGKDRPRVFSLKIEYSVCLIDAVAFFQA